MRLISWKPNYEKKKS